MKKLVPAVIAAATMSMLAGCAVDSADVGEASADQSQGVCAADDATQAMLAALATTMATEMGEIELYSDFYIFRGAYNQEQLGLSSKGLSKCSVASNGCQDTKFLLMFQDASKYDGKLVFGTSRLSAWTYASSLATGWRNLQSCVPGGWCKYPAHVLSLHADPAVPNPNVTACGSFFTYDVKSPAGVVISDTSQLKNALMWTNANGTNKYVQFSNGPGTITFDPDGGVVGGDTSGSTSGASTCPTAAGVNNLGTIYTTCQTVGTAGTDLTGQACQYGAACGTLYKAWPSFPNKYKCNAQGC